MKPHGISPNTRDARHSNNCCHPTDADVRLAGLIAIDVACYENFPTKKIALDALAKALENPGKLDHQLLLRSPSSTAMRRSCRAWRS